MYCKMLCRGTEVYFKEVLCRGTQVHCRLLAMSRVTSVKIDFASISVMGIEVEMSPVGVGQGDVAAVTVKMSLVEVGPAGVVAMNGHCVGYIR